MQMKNLARSVLAISGVLLFLWACKHEIPDPNPADGGSTGGGGTTGGAQPCSPDSVYFQQQILPLIVSNCAGSGCHDAISHAEGLNLTTYSGIMKIVKAGNPGGSKLISVITTNNNGDRMPPPPAPKMPQDQINLITKWIQQGAKNNSCSSACDTSQFTYAAVIKPIISNQCQGCHTGTAAGGGIDLSTYNGVKSVASNGQLWGSVHKDPGFAPMPPAGTGLSSCQLTQMKKWIDAGAPNN